ncbi:hypothetical protein AMTRI_Chr06g201040 [Amborella trichopoda]
MSFILFPLFCCEFIAVYELGFEDLSDSLINLVFLLIWGFIYSFIYCVILFDFNGVVCFEGWRKKKFSAILRAFVISLLQMASNKLLHFFVLFFQNFEFFVTLFLFKERKL